MTRKPWEVREEEPGIIRRRTMSEKEDWLVEARLHSHVWRHCVRMVGEDGRLATLVTIPGVPCFPTVGSNPVWIPRLVRMSRSVFIYKCQGEQGFWPVILSSNYWFAVTHVTADTSGRLACGPRRPVSTSFAHYYRVSFAWVIRLCTIWGVCTDTKSYTSPTSIIHVWNK